MDDDRLVAVFQDALTPLVDAMRNSVVRELRQEWQAQLAVVVSDHSTLETMDPSADRDFWLAIRQALLMYVDAIERKMEMCPRTAALRKSWKCGRIGIEHE